MTLYTVSFVEERLSEAAVVRNNLVEMGGVEFWTGLWFIELGERPERWVGDMFTLPAFFVAEFDAAGAFFYSGPKKLEARKFFAEKVGPRMMKVRPEAEQRMNSRYFGSGERRFSDVLSQYSDADDRLTPLCHIMADHGSDKGIGWHNYTRLYSLLFAPIASRVSDVLEIGLGTNNVDVPSNMGPDGVPGASLRGWRTYLPQATIYGADVDRRVLFNEHRIRTSFVDQLQPESFVELWQEQPNLFDIIIDDGLHTLAAASNTLQACVDRLRPEGIYVVEDVAGDAAPEYIDLFERHGMSGVFVSLPHPLNRFDNNLIIGVRDKLY